MRRLREQGDNGRMGKLSRRNQRGFTLVELMIVVALIAVIASLAIPNYMRFSARAARSEMLETVGKMKLHFKNLYDNQGTMSTPGTIAAGASSTVNPPGTDVGQSAAWDSHAAGWSDFPFPPDGAVRMRYSYSMGAADPQGNVVDVTIVVCGSFRTLGANVVSCPGGMTGNYRYTEVFHASGASDPPVEFPEF